MFDYVGLVLIKCGPVMTSCPDRNLLVVSMVVFLTSTVCMAPVEGEYWPDLIFLHKFDWWFDSDALFRVPEKEEVEVEGELSEEEEGTYQSEKHNW